MTGFFDSVFKRSKRQVIRDNAAQGKEGEENIKRDYEWSGYKVKRTGRGHDYKATKKNWFTGKKETKYIEVKTGNAKLSPLQKKKKRSLGKKYVVERTSTNPFSSMGKNLFGSSESKPKKKKSKKRKTTKKKSNTSIFGSSGVDIWGSSGSKSKKKSKKRKTTKKKSSPDIFGSSGVDIWGTSGSKSKRKSKKKRNDSFGFGDIGF